MAFTDQQWGRLLALAWLEPGFKKELEKSAASAFSYLKENEAQLRIKYGDFILEDLGLTGENIVPANFENMAWEGIDFGGMTGERLDECIRGDNIAGMKPAESLWYWKSYNNNAVNPNPPTETLQGEDWVRIYARIWMDIRLDDPSISPDLKKKYIPHRNYMADFEQDPAKTVSRIKDEFDKLKFDPLNPSTLYELTDAPKKDPNFNNQILTQIVKTGKAEEEPLVWDFKKCL